MARISMPMMLGRTATGTYLATTAMAFPESTADWLTAVPANAALRVTRDGFAARPLEPRPGRPADPLPWGAVEAAVLTQLADGQAHGMGALGKATAACWPEGCIPQSAMAIYEILRGLQRSGRLEVVRQTVAGAENGLTAPRFSARRRDAAAAGS